MDKVTKQALAEKLGWEGVWEFVCRDKHGRIKWVERARNLITDQGINHALNVVFDEETPVTEWYILLKNAGTVAAGDTLASHTGWTENTNCGSRQAYVVAQSTAKSITNSASKASFTATADDQTIAGGGLCSVASGTSGILFSAVDFSGGAKALDTGDKIEVTYTVNGSST